MSYRHRSYWLNRISYLPPPTQSPTRSIKFSLSRPCPPRPLWNTHTHTRTHTHTLLHCRLLSPSMYNMYILCVCVACQSIVLINQRPWTWKRISLQYCNLNQQMQIIFLYIYSCVRCGYLFDFVIACRSFVRERFFSLFLLRVFDILDNIVPIHIIIRIYMHTHDGKRAPLVSAACVYAK